MRQLKDSIAKGLLSPVYLFYGEEPYLQDEVIKSIAALVAPDGNNWNLDYFDGQTTDLSKIIVAASTAPFFSTRRLIVVRNVAWFQKKSAKLDLDDAQEEVDTKEDMQALLDYLTDPVPENCLIFTVNGEIDKRRKIVKAIEKAGRIVEFAALKGTALSDWAQKTFLHLGKKADNDAVEYLLVIAGSSLYFLQNEIAKICSYCQDKPKVTRRDVEDVASRGSILNQFNLIDAIAAKDGVKAVAIYRDMLEQGEAPQKILAYLGGQLHNMLMIFDLSARGFGEADIVSQLHLHPFVVKKNRMACKNLSLAGLIRSLELFLNVDIANKTGQGEIVCDLELAIIRICS